MLYFTAVAAIPIVISYALSTRRDLGAGVLPSRPGGKFLEKGRKEGYIRKEISFDAAMIYLTMYLDVLQRPDLQKNTNKELLKELLDLMIYGLAGQPINDKLE